MRTSEYFSLYSASACRRKDPSELDSPLLWTMLNFYSPAGDFFPTTPCPTFVIPDFPGTLPCHADVGFNYASWFDLGAYYVLLQSHDVDVEMAWNAPGRPQMWDLTEDIAEPGDDPIMAETGAGHWQLLRDNDLKCGMNIGGIAVLFRDGEMGQLVLSGDWEQPFTYNRSCNTFTNASYPVLMDGLCWVLMSDGMLYRTEGQIPKPASMQLDLKAHGYSWPEANDVPMGFDGTTYQIVADVSDDVIWVNPLTGSYGIAAEGNPMIQTGRLQIVTRERRCQIYGIRLRYKTTGAGWGVTLSAKGIDDSSWVAGESLALGEGVDLDETLWVNASVIDPQIQIEVTTEGAGLLKLLGFNVLYDDLGPRE